GKAVDVLGNHGLGGLLEEGAHEKSPKYLEENLGDFREFCKGLVLSEFCNSCRHLKPLRHTRAWPEYLFCYGTNYRYSG
ncbi:hypothetical protein, partial [Neisseria dentiae]|uniref:hypothetical protein n=1 Tax=Neisseria dentiae TaxID=194197 RepID=UPI00359F6BD0